MQIEASGKRIETIPAVRDVERRLESKVPETKFHCAKDSATSETWAPSRRGRRSTVAELLPAQARSEFGRFPGKGRSHLMIIL